MALDLLTLFIYSILSFVAGLAAMIVQRLDRERLRLMIGVAAIVVGGPLSSGRSSDRRPPREPGLTTMVYIQWKSTLNHVEDNRVVEGADRKSVV